MSHESVTASQKLSSVMKHIVDATASSCSCSLVSHLLKLHMYGKAVLEVLVKHLISLIQQIVPGAVFSGVAI